MDGGIELTFNSNFLAAKGFLKVQFSMKKKKKSRAVLRERQVTFLGLMFRKMKYLKIRPRK